MNDYRILLHFQFNVTLWQKIVVIFTLHLFGDLKSQLLFVSMSAFANTFHSFLILLPQTVLNVNDINYKKENFFLYMNYFSKRGQHKLPYFCTTSTFSYLHTQNSKFHGFFSNLKFKCQSHYIPTHFRIHNSVDTCYC